MAARLQLTRGILLAAVSLTLITACGGGGGGTATASPAAEDPDDTASAQVEGVATPSGVAVVTATNAD